VRFDRVVRRPTLYVPAGATGGTVATTNLMLPLEKSSLTVTWYFGGDAAPATGAVATSSATATAVAPKTRRARVKLRIASLPPRRLPPQSPDLETLRGFGSCSDVGSQLGNAPLGERSA